MLWSVPMHLKMLKIETKVLVSKNEESIRMVTQNDGGPSPIFHGPI
jgi:hypothetical protein